MRPTLNSIFLVLIGLCFLFALAVVALDAGVHATPWETADSQGRTMQFSDRFSAEHYRIVLGNIRPWQIFQPRYFYDWLLLAMMGVGAWRLGSEERSRTPSTRWFFFGQSALFFLVWMGMPFSVVPETMIRLSRCQLTRGDFVDVPFTWMMAQPPWVLVSLVIAVSLPGEPLGLKDATKRAAKFVRSRV